MNYTTANVTNVLTSHSISFSFSSEADSEIASLANALKCPVLSHDSDFFIFDVEGGFIPLSSFAWQSCPSIARIFYREKLAQYFGINSELLPLFASLVGNDYVTFELRKPFYGSLQLQGTFGDKKEKTFRTIAELLLQAPTSTEKEAIEFVIRHVRRGKSKNDLRRAVEISLQEYKITEKPLVGYFLRNDISSYLKIQNNQEIEGWVLRRFRDGRFSTSCMSSLVSGKVLLRFQVENLQETSANHCSQSLRTHIYGILTSASLTGGKRAMVQEWDRVGNQVDSTRISPTDGENVPCLSEIPSLGPDNKLAIFLHALDSNTTNIKSLPELKLVAASVRFLTRNAHPKLEPNHLSAILCSCVKLEDGSWEKYLENCDGEAFDVRAAHSFCQWQCVLRDAIHLNCVLEEPIETPCIRKIFNGQLVHHLNRELARGNTFQSDKEGPKESCYVLMHEGGGEGGKGGCNMKKVWVKMLRKFRPRDCKLAPYQFARITTSLPLVQLIKVQANILYLMALMLLVVWLITCDPSLSLLFALYFFKYFLTEEFEMATAPIP